MLLPKKGLYFNSNASHDDRLRAAILASSGLDLWPHLKFTSNDVTVYYDVGPSEALELLLWMEALNSKKKNTTIHHSIHFFFISSTNRFLFAILVKLQLGLLVILSYRVDRDQQISYVLLVSFWGLSLIFYHPNWFLNPT